MKIKLNVINRDGTQTTINVKEGTTIRDAIEDKIAPESFGICDKIFTTCAISFSQTPTPKKP